MSLAAGARLGAYEIVSPLIQRIVMVQDWAPEPKARVPLPA